MKREIGNMNDTPPERVAHSLRRAPGRQCPTPWSPGRNGPLAHLPSGVVYRERRLADLRRDHLQPAARGRVPSLRFHAKARGATIRADLIDVAARLARRGRDQLQPCTCRSTGTAKANGWPCSKPPAARPPGRPDQPNPVTARATAPRHPAERHR